MINKIISAIFLILLFAGPARSATTGFLSFEYSQGLSKESDEFGAFRGVQVGLIFSGLISPAIAYSAELHLRDGRFEVMEAWLSLFTSESFRLKMGMFLVPFGKYNSSRRPFETLLIRPPLNVQYAFPSYWRDIGAMAEGRTGRFRYAFYLGNGLVEETSLNDGQQFDDNNANKSIGGSLGWFISQSFEVGYSYCRGKMDDGDKRPAVLQNVDVSWNDPYFQVIAEYTRGAVENPEDYSQGKIEGFYVQASIFLQTVHPFACFQNLEYSDPFHGQGFLRPDIAGSGIEINRRRWALGIAYIPVQGVLIKLEYDLDNDRLADIKDSGIIFQAALRF